MTRLHDLLLIMPLVCIPDPICWGIQLSGCALSAHASLLCTKAHSFWTAPF